MPTVAEIQQRIHSYLPKVVRAYETLDNGAITVRQGSARIFIHCSDWGDGNVLVDLRALVLRRVPATPEFFEFIASTDFNFGTLTTRRDDQGTVDLYLSHKLLGDFMDPTEFELALVLVGRMADKVDDEIKVKFGGTRFHED